MKKIFQAVPVCFLLLLTAGSAVLASKPGEEVDERTRCPVCGMFVAKYQQWLARVTMSNGKTEVFDGVKDMMAYYQSPQQYGAPDGITVKEVFVKDYYNQQWIDGRKAFYVIGSDVYGPMGHELVPFGERAAADNFLKDHHGSKILAFSEIDGDLIESLRKGHKMKGMQ